MTPHDIHTFLAGLGTGGIAGAIIMGLYMRYNFKRTIELYEKSMRNIFERPRA